MDMQIMPTVIGAVLMYAVLGQLNDPTVNLDENLLKLCVSIAFATAPLLFGFCVHLDALSSPESPFNKHSAPQLMVLICSGSFSYAAYRFHRADFLLGLIIFLLLALAIVIAEIIAARMRKKNRQLISNNAGQAPVLSED